jgi:hypothetical protein
MAEAIVQSSCAKLRSAIAVGGDATGDLQEIMEDLEAILPMLEDAERQSLRDEAPSAMDLWEYQNKWEEMVCLFTKSNIYVVDVCSGQNLKRMC